VFEKYDIRGCFNLAKYRANGLLDEDYVMRRNAVDFGVPLFMEPKVSFSNFVTRFTGANHPTDCCPLRAVHE
jgi:hypothetical protein